MHTNLGIAGNGSLADGTVHYLLQIACCVMRSVFIFSERWAEVDLSEDVH
jgi:hypothetical protein